jgi:hypothetical protein
MIGTVPPSALQAAPVTYDARSEQRKAITEAISPGSARRPSGRDVQRLPDARRLVAAAGRHDGRSLGGEHVRRGQADAAGRAGDETHGAAQSEIHGSLA